MLAGLNIHCRVVGTNRNTWNTPFHLAASALEILYSMRCTGSIDFKNNIRRIKAMSYRSRTIAHLMFAAAM